jgi:hypothetical protein
MEICSKLVDVIGPRLARKASRGFIEWEREMMERN